MIDFPFEILTWAVDQIDPPALKRVDYCANPHPKYTTEEHCPPKRAPDIPRRGQF